MTTNGSNGSRDSCSVSSDIVSVVSRSDSLIALLFLTSSVPILQIYNEERRRFSLVKNQPRRIVEKVASDIEKLLAKKRKALDVSLFPIDTEYRNVQTNVLFYFPVISSSALNNGTQIYIAPHVLFKQSHISFYNVIIYDSY